MTSNEATVGDTVSRGEVSDGESIDLLWDGHDWVISAQTNLPPTAVCRAIEALLINELELPGEDDIEDKPLKSTEAAAMYDLDEWIAAPETNEYRTAGIDDVAEIKQDDGTWTVDLAPYDELQVVA